MHEKPCLISIMKRNRLPVSSFQILLVHVACLFVIRISAVEHDLRCSNPFLCSPFLSTVSTQGDSLTFCLKFMIYISYCRVNWHLHSGEEVPNTFQDGGYVGFPMETILHVFTYI